MCRPMFRLIIVLSVFCFIAGANAAEGYRYLARRYRSVLNRADSTLIFRLAYRGRSRNGGNLFVA